MLTNKNLPDAFDIIMFFDLLDNLDSFQIEEAKELENPTFDNIKNVNSGNNCLHFCMIYDIHRIVIQTYKEMNHSELDIVQGKPESEEIFQEIVDFINQNKYWMTDIVLNKLFVLYNWYNTWCSTMYFTEFNSFCCEFGPNVDCFWTPQEGFIINAEQSSIEEIKRVIYFINQIGDICGKRS